MKVNYTDWMHVHGRETYCLQITIIDPVVTQRLCWWFCTCVFILLPQETKIAKMTYFFSLQQFVVCLYFVFYLITLWGIRVLVISSFLFYFYRPRTNWVSSIKKPHTFTSKMYKCSSCFKIHVCALKI